MSKDTLSIVLPIHNEKETLEVVISSWTQALMEIPNCEFNFLLCEDGSTDGTKELIQDIMHKYSIINLSVESRRGYGKAVLDGIQNASSKYILCIDSDGQCCPHDFLQFWENREKADFLIGWRKPRRDPLIRLLYSNIFFLLHKILFFTHIHDPSCPYVLGRHEAYQDVIQYLNFMREGFWWGFVGACIKTKKSLFEIKIQHQKRYAGNTQVYRLKKMPSIIINNIIGLIKLRFAHY